MTDRTPEFAAGWECPTQLVQLDLFPEPRDRFLAMAGVSTDESERWRALGWMSFDVRDVYALQEGQVHEICFVRDIARSGLSDLMVTALLRTLKRPYSYDSSRCAWSFRDGWVQLPVMPTRAQRNEYIEQHLDQWIEEKTILGEYQLLARTSRKLLTACVELAPAGEEIPAGPGEEIR